MSIMKPLLGILFLIVCGCTNQIELNTPQEQFTITGNTYHEFQGYQSRSSSSKDFPQGSQISFFSKGGINCENVILTYQGNCWQHDLKWEKAPQTAHIQAYYPEFPSNTSELYDSNGVLKDILSCNQQVSYQSNINLSFSHLFALLNLEAKPYINSEIKQIGICTSKSITAIEPYSGDIVWDEQPSPMQYLDKRDDGVYPFIIPPTNALDISIELVFLNGEKKTLPIQTRKYLPNKKYSCQLISKDHEPGIYSVEDMIAFAHLFNGKEYNGRTLDEFATTIQGKTTYKLYNDLYFTEEDNKRMQGIGHQDSSDSIEFSDCFDGMGHTIHQLNLSFNHPIENYNFALFYKVGKNGIIKNLTLEKCSFSGQYYWYFESTIGIIVAKNEGLIEHCQCISSAIKHDNAKVIMGGIASRNLSSGIIKDCASIQNDFNSQLNYKFHAGGICGYNYGEILNCFAANCTYAPRSYSGGISSYSIQNSKTINCYTYQLEKEIPQGGITCECSTSSIIKYCYYIQKNIIGDSKKKLPYTYKYNPERMTVYIKDENKSLPLIKVLNDWVDNKAPTSYPQYHFSAWTESQDPPIVLEVP